VGNKKDAVQKLPGLRIQYQVLELELHQCTVGKKFRIRDSWMQKEIWYPKMGGGNTEK